MNIVLWILQILLAAGLAAAGLNHIRGYNAATVRRGMEWMGAVPPTLLRTIGGLEVLGAIGLILPALTGIAPWLTTLAAACVAVLMLLAAGFHARRPGEQQSIVFNLILAAIALVIVVGRLFVVPF